MLTILILAYQQAEQWQLKWLAVRQALSQSCITGPDSSVALFFFISFIAYNVYLRHAKVKHNLNK